MLIYGKKVTIEATGTEPTRTETHLFGTTKTIPSITDKELVYKDNNGQEIDATVVHDFKFYYNKDKGVFANSSVRQIPSDDATPLNVYIEDENGALVKVIECADFEQKFALSISATGTASEAAVNPTSALVGATDTASIAIVTSETKYTATASVSPTTACTVAFDATENPIVMMVSSVTAPAEITVTINATA